MNPNDLVVGQTYYRVFLDKYHEDSYITELEFEKFCPSLVEPYKDRWIFSNTAKGDSKYLLCKRAIEEDLFAYRNDAVIRIRADMLDNIDRLKEKMKKWVCEW